MEADSQTSMGQGTATGVDHLIVGQGLAGTLLADHLLKKGRRIAIIDPCDMDSASWVAGGMFNPVSPMQPTLSWRADELLPFSLAYWREKEQEIGKELLFEKPIVKLFTSLEEKEKWETNKIKKGFDGFILEEEPDLPEGIIQTDIVGSMSIRGGYVDLHKFMSHKREEWKMKGVLRPGKLDATKIEPLGPFEWRDVYSPHLIFCDGAHAFENPLINDIPFRPNKGDILTVEIPDLNLEPIVKRSVGLLQFNDGTFKVGATYEHEELFSGPTSKARSELIKGLREITDRDPTILDQRSGVRPATKDTKPVAGTHPSYPRIGVFNGLGSKGVMNGPLWADKVAHHFIQNVPMDKEVSPSRFFKNK